MNADNSTIFIRTKDSVPTKFVVAKANKTSLFFVADIEADQHRELLDKNDDLDIEVLGGGLVTVCPESNLILIVGQSVEFGKEDRQMTRKILELHYEKIWGSVEVGLVE